MPFVNSTIVIADDLTGANDTALQYFRNGKSAKIIIEINQDFSSIKNTDVIAISTESRNVDSQEAYDRVFAACEKLKNSFETENFYKKIDSTLRGNLGPEIITTLNATQKEAAIIAPAYIEESRVTVGGYQLLNGIALERTQCALDPKAPIFESYIPDIINHSIDSNISNLTGLIGLNVVSKGAALIVNKIKEFVESGKKLIIADAMSNTDLEQIALAINKSNINLLPCGSAGLASAINSISDPYEVKHIKHTPNLPKLIVSGSATQLTSRQISKLKSEKNKIHCIDLTVNDIIQSVSEDITKEITDKLIQGIDVIVHSSNINVESASEETENMLIDAGIAKKEFPDKITDFLGNLVKEINNISNFILIAVGGETSYKCAKKMNSGYLEILDVIMPAVPLCMDMHGKIIVTKSGNFGFDNTLIDIFNYFEDRK